MFRLLLILILVSNISAKIYKQNGGKNDELGDGNDHPINNGNVEHIIGDPLWVLHLSNDKFLDPKLKLGTSAEQEDFYYSIGPSIREARPQTSNRRVKKDDPEHPKKVPQTVGSLETRTNSDLKNDIMKMINKFALSTSIEPDSYLTESEDGNNPSISLYFKGSITSLVVKLGVKQWHYNITPSPFPAWFYERHDTFEAPLKIPDDVINKFYSSLLRLLKLVLYYPL